MSEENRQNQSGDGEKRSGGGKRRYFRRRRRKGKKNDQRGQEATNAKSSGDGAGSSERRRSSRNKKRRSRRRRPDSTRQQQPESVVETTPEPEQPYEEPTSVYVYTYVVRPAYRDAIGDYRPESSFAHASDEDSFQSTSMEYLLQEINEQLDRRFADTAEESAEA